MGNIAPPPHFLQGDLEPFLIRRRRHDWSLAVAARAEGNVISLAPASRAIPDPPRRKCPCADCGRWLVCSLNRPDGHATLTLFKPHPGDESGP